MIGCLRTCVRKQSTIELYFEFENELEFYNLEASTIHTILYTLVKLLSNKGEQNGLLVNLPIVD